MTSTRFAVTDTTGLVVDPVLPESLRPFLEERAGTPGQQVRLTGSGPQPPSRTAVARPEPAGGWLVEVDRDGRALVARAPNTDAVFDLLRSWAADDDWWLEAFGWKPR